MSKKTAKAVKSETNIIQKNKKPIIIAGICAGAAALGAGLLGAFKSMKKSAKAQHEVDKAEVAAAKAEARADFEENRGKNTYKKAKAQGKKSRDDARMSIAERAKATQAERDEKIIAANKRKAEAEARIDAAKNN